MCSSDLLILDTQIGWSDALTERKKLEPLLRLPFVHLALDPEFATKGEHLAPGQTFGTLDGDAVAAARMDSLLALHPTPARPTLDAATIVARVTATAQPRGFSTQSPATGRASWAATFGWRRLAGFASVAVFGFLIGFTDLDSSFLSSDDAEPATGIFGVFEDAPW